MSLRVEASTVDGLDRLALQTGTSRNALAARYLAEGVRRDEFPQITFREAALGRRAAVRYYAAHRDEVDEIAAREIATAERAEELWRAGQELLAS